MAKLSEWRGNTSKDIDREQYLSGGTQVKGGQPQRGRGSPDDALDRSRGSGTLGARQRTEAGGTGTSGGQISPQPGMRNPGGSSS